MVPVRPAVFFLDSPKVYVKPRLSPSCKNCKYFRNQNSTEWDPVGVCTLFKYQGLEHIEELSSYVHSEHCRSLDELCGPNGDFYKSKYLN